MTEDVDQPNEEAGEQAEGPLAGERLAEARREQQISVNEIAKELHLDEHKVRALERNEFDILGAPVFAKGYLKKYAQLVSVRDEDVIADYYHLTRSTIAPPIVSVRQRPRQELSPGPWIAIIVVIIIAVTAYWWFTRPESVPEDTAPLTEVVSPDSEANETEQHGEAGLPEAGQPDAQPDAADEANEPEEAAAQPTETAPPTPMIEETSSPEIVPGQMRLLITYTGDCWTEITDANGRRLLFDLGKDGRSVELSGAEPFNVLFGNPGNVIVRVNGEDFALPPTNRPDRPMRLTISGN
jgi:cytoskeleton protein RodZ